MPSVRPARNVFFGDMSLMVTKKKAKQANGTTLIVFCIIGVNLSGVRIPRMKIRMNFNIL